MTNKITNSQVSKGVLKQFSIGYAPFREGCIEKISDSQKNFDSKKFKQWLAMGNHFAEELEITIDSCVDTLGIYGATNAKMEASAVVTITATEEQVNIFAALMGTLAPDIQHSVMVNTYDVNGGDTEHHITFKSPELAQEFVIKKKLYGVHDLSVDPKTNTAIILDIPSHGVNFNVSKFLLNHGQDFTEHREFDIRVTFVEKENYRGILQGAWNSYEQWHRGNAGQNLNDIFHVAITRINRQSGNSATLSQPKKRALSKKQQFTQIAYNYISLFKDEFGLTFPKMLGAVINFNEETSKSICAAYSSLKIDNSENLEVRHAYLQLVKEVEAQYEYLVNEVKLKVTFIENDPYDNSEHMIHDVQTNNHLKIFKGGEPHPFLDAKDDKGVSATEKFRVVHDFFGHAVEGNQFGKIGEEAAWIAHSKMFSPIAQTAMSTETRGQNSWVNNAPVNTAAIRKFAVGNDLIKEGFVTAGKKLIKEAKSEYFFADQKVDLLPIEWTTMTT